MDSLYNQKNKLAMQQKQSVGTNSLLSPEWIARLQECDQVLVGLSGGLDSTVLLHQLASYSQLKSRLLAVHINHGISSNSLSWQKHCEQFCHHLKIPFCAEHVEFPQNANIEEEARKARFAAFSRLLNDNGCLVLGHHLDDQAETVLLQLFRGAGVDGLSGIQEWGRFAKGSIARPFLTHSRERLHHYAITQKLTWVTDESNADVRYTRNYLRHQIMPLLLKKWPGVMGNLARTATHCQQAKRNLDELALLDCPDLSTGSDSLDISLLHNLTEQRIINVLRVWLKKNHIQLPTTAIFKRLISELLGASIDANPIVAWNEILVRRYQNRIYIVKKDQKEPPKEIQWTHFPKEITVNNKTLYAQKTLKGLFLPPNAEISIKFRQGGELFVLHQQTKQLKKLFQEWRVPVWRREHIPLLYINQQLAAVVGYAISDLFYRESSSAWSFEYK